MPFADTLKWYTSGLLRESAHESLVNKDKRYLSSSGTHTRAQFCVTFLQSRFWFGTTVTYIALKSFVHLFLQRPKRRKLLRIVERVLASFPAMLLKLPRRSTLMRITNWRKATDSYIYTWEAKGEAELEQERYEGKMLQLEKNKVVHE